MNDQIKELALKSGIAYLSEHTAYLQANDGLTVLPSISSLEKFAELIVRECMDICITENVSNLDLNVMHNSSKFEIQNMATKSCGENLANRIKEYFGVEDIEEDTACPLCGEDGGTTCGMEGCQY